MARAKAETGQAERGQLPATSSADDGTASETNAPTTQRANRGNRTPAGEETATDGPRNPVDAQALSENLAQIIVPVAQKVSHGLIRALEPVLHEYQERVAETIEEQVERAFPAIGNTKHQDAKRDGKPPFRGKQSHGEPSRPQLDGNVLSGSGDSDDEWQRNSTAAGERGDDSPADADVTSPNNSPGGTQMTAKAAQSEKTTNDETAQDEPQPAKQKNRRQRAGDKTGRAQAPTYYYNPQSAARAGLLRLATEWKEAGSAYQAIHAYMEILNRYPQTGAAAAATEGLVDLANTLQKQGRFYAALNIYHKLDAML